jgi:hypothetical protein
MKIWDTIKSALPFVIGLLIGGGLSKNKYVWIILVSYFVGVSLFGLLKDKIVKVKDSVDKGQAIKEVANDTLMDAAEATARGNAIGASMFDKWYGEIIFYVNIALFIAVFILLFSKAFTWAAITFCFMWVLVVLNQIWRKVKYLEVQ